MKRKTSPDQKNKPSKKLNMSNLSMKDALKSTMEVKITKEDKETLKGKSS